MHISQSLSDPRIVELIQNGEVGVLPTDTIYGLVAAADRPEAVKYLYALKGREHKPGTVIAASTAQLEKLGIKARYLKAVEQFWPGAISIEIPHSLEYLHQGTGRQAFRITADVELNQLLFKTGPLLTSSANLPGQPPANTLAEAQAAFKNGLAFYVDGGDLSNRQPSTIIRIVDDAIEVVRVGAVKLDEAGRIIK